jgi:hypothetical protein
MTLTRIWALSGWLTQDDVVAHNHDKGKQRGAGLVYESLSAGKLGELIAEDISKLAAVIGRDVGVQHAQYSSRHIPYTHTHSPALYKSSSYSPDGMSIVS